MSYSITQSYYTNISGATAHTEGMDTYWTSKLVIYSMIFSVINVCICAAPCDTIDATVPTSTFGGCAFKVSAETYNLGSDALSSDCLAGIVASSQMDFTIIGDVFLQNVYSVFDYANTRVGFAELACGCID
ncbi:Asp-domain-containing protein [Suillus decipiens]|nr:Asp-domain-containing protein [Suillus decipiens]